MWEINSHREGMNTGTYRYERWVSDEERRKVLTPDKLSGRVADGGDTNDTSSQDDGGMDASDGADSG